MLNPNNKTDRLFYGNILSPPKDYTLDFAIGTTYSLDFDALIGASISLDLSDDLDSDLMENSIYLLEALRRTSDKVSLFCENGHIILPKNPTPLYILLENMVFQVKTDKFLKNRYASFHPKFWLIKYTKNDDVVYRLIVLSRNLTFDRDWDISFVMEGRKVVESNKKNNALIQFIDYLCKFSTDKLKKAKMREIMNELEYIEFNLNSNTFKDFDIYINGIGDDYNIQNAQLFENDNLNELMIVSPFLSQDVISDFNTRKINTSSKALLFTRLNSLESLNQYNCSNFEVYTLKDEIIDGESLVSEGSDEIANQDIHAKIYVVEREKFTDLYLGSLNASHNALNGNVELMIKLQALKSKLDVGKLADDLFNGDKGGPKSPFQIRNVEEFNLKEESEEDDFDLMIKYISRLNSNAKIMPNGDFFDIELVFEDIDWDKFNGIDVSIKPLLINRPLGFSNKMIFEKLNKLSLSNFFVVQINNNLSKVIKIPTTGMPEDRQNEVISNIITDENAFIKYVAFLLGDEFVLNVDNNFVGNIGSGMNVELPELYEKMLKATIYSPEKFKELEFLISALSDDNVIPDGFEELYNTFIEVLD